MDQPFETSVRTATVRSRTSLVSQVVTVAAVVIPPFGVLSAMGLLWGVAFHWVDLVLLVVLYVLTALGNAIGFHRYFTHKGFETGPVVKTALAVFGSMAMQGPITQWVTNHRKHHALSDKEGDPHSPHVGHGDGVLGAIRGFLHSHVGWLFTLKGLERGREYGKDLYEDRLNNRLVAVLVLGEGWHNNHHAFPSSARHGLHRWQVDVSWWVIRALEKLGLVWDVKRPTVQQMARRRVQPAEA